VNFHHDVFNEIEVGIVNSYKENKFNEGLHTFNPWNNIVIIDGFQTENRWLLKPIFVIMRYFRRLLK